jgi:hypothetical protein
MKKSLFAIAAFLCLVLSGSAYADNFKGYYYQIKIYHLKDKTQENRVDSYLKTAYLPALHRAGIKNVGVFKPIAKDSLEQLVYVLIPFKKLDEFASLDSRLKTDQQYLADGKDYLNAAFDNAPYIRQENIVLKAFSGMLSPKAPALTGPKSERVYELRSYESATESQSLNKIGMFNDAEMSIFTNLNFNAVFYGQVIAGSRMPNLMYMTTFNNKADRDKHWADFGAAYKAIKDLPQYQHNTSKNSMFFLYPVEYSDI